MKLLKKFSTSPFLNKYTIALSIFVVWMLFFDRNDVFSQLSRKNELNEANKSIQYFKSEIEKEKLFVQELQTNPASVEQLAREKYLMKKDNEDLFIIQQVKKY